MYRVSSEGLTASAQSYAVCVGARLGPSCQPHSTQPLRPNCRPRSPFTPEARRELTSPNWACCFDSFRAAEASRQNLLATRAAITAMLSERPYKRMLTASKRCPTPPKRLRRRRALTTHALATTYAVWEFPRPPLLVQRKVAREQATRRHFGHLPTQARTSPLTLGRHAELRGTSQMSSRWQSAHQ